MYKKLNIIVFIVALTTLCVFVFILLPDPKAQEYENRSMAVKPEFNAEVIFNGKFFSDFEAYLIDKTAYRTSFLKFANSAEQFYGVSRKDRPIMVDIDNNLGMGLIPDEEPSPIDVPAANDMPDHNDTTPTGNTTTPGNTVPPGNTMSQGNTTPPGNARDSSDAPSAGDMSTQSNTPTAGDAPAPGDTPAPGSAPAHNEVPASGNYSATDAEPVPVGPNHVAPYRPFSVDTMYDEGAIIYNRYRETTSAALWYADVINAYRDALPGKIRVFSLLAPTHAEFMGEQYESVNDSQSDTIMKINERLGENIITVDAYSKIAAHTEEYVYFRTDHHWTALGAYYAYLAFAEAAGFEPVTIDNYIEHSIPNYIGSLAVGTQSRAIIEHPDTMYYYELDNGTEFSRNMFVIPANMSSLSYRIFLGGDYAKLDFTSSNANGRTLVVVKDSYANAFVIWAAPNYERIIVIDPRQYEGRVTRLIQGIQEVFYYTANKVDLLIVDHVGATVSSDYVELLNNVR